jgi:hypothetical protein
VLLPQQFPSDLLQGGTSTNTCRCKDSDCNTSECLLPDGGSCSCDAGGWGGAAVKSCTPQERSCAGLGYKAAGAGYAAPSSIFAGGVRCANDAKYASVCSSPPFNNC